MSGTSVVGVASEIMMLIGGGCVLLLIVAAIAFFLVGIYNSLQRLRISAEGAFSDIDVQLRRRHDLIPNLVETVKGYAGHERATLEAVIAARSRAASATGIPDKIAAEGQLTQALGRLFAVAEAYPDLKANTNFLQLQGELANTENIISQSRGGYNGAVQNFNQTVAVFPNNIVAGLFQFKPMEFFKEQDPGVREAPQVKF